jgi:hypothetical protein
LRSRNERTPPWVRVLAQGELIVGLAVSIAIASLPAHAQGVRSSACAEAHAFLRDTSKLDPQLDSTIRSLRIDQATSVARSCLGSLESRLRTQRDPTYTSAIRSPAQILQLSANTNTKDKTVQAQGALLWGDGSGNAFGAALGFEGPLDANADRSDLADVGQLRTLTNATTLELNINFYRWAPVTDTSKLRAYCDKIRARLKIADTVRSHIGWCFAGSDEVPASMWHDLSSFVTSAGLPITIAGTAKVGRRDITYADAQTLVDSTVNRTPWSIGVAAGLYVPRSASLVAFGYDRVHDEKAGRTTQLCSPIGTSGSLRCRSTTFGAPSADERDVLSAEARRYYSQGFGFSLRAESDLRDGTFSIALPLYFLTSKSSGLNGGVAPQWSSDHRTLSMTVFVGGFAPPIVASP